MPRLCAPPAPARLLAYRMAIPTAALLLFGTLALLRVQGQQALYLAALRFFAVAPFRFPFLDIHAILAAAQCHRLGIDVYLSNPCDVLGRPAVYSPLWLLIVPRSLGTSDTIWVGFGLDLFFILSLPAVLRPRTGGETLLLALVALSPMAVYALERANNDLIVFELVLAGCALGSAGRPVRFASYALYIVAGLLKYYPLVLLVLIVRERRGDAIRIAAVAAAVLLLFVAGEHRELGKALANVPAASYFTDAFSAQNLPFGIADKLIGPNRRTALGIALLVAFVLTALARTRRTLPLVGAPPAEASPFENECLIVGAILLTGCFLAGQNVDYRGIYFLLVMPGLLRLYWSAEDGATQQFAARMLTAVIVVSWGEPLRRIVSATAGAIPSMAVGVRVEVLFWFGRELLWWWLMAGFAAIALSTLLCHRRRLPLGTPIRIPLWAVRDRPEISG